MLPNIEIIVGTYEEFLLGYQFKQQEADKIQLKQTFADKSHAGSIKCLAVQGPWIATGGSDDRIFIYDMRSRKQSQILLSHTGTINALVFSPDLTHLLSGSTDGHMIATRVGSWSTEGDWRKAHSGSPVTHISCHPSSKLALSLGGDQVLHTWNLVKGRVAYKTNLKSKRSQLGSYPECLSWSTDGNHFTLSGPLALEVWDIKTANVVRSVKMPSKPICVSWLSETELVTGLENGQVAWVTLQTKDEPKLIPAHAARVKAMAYLSDTLATVSSAGELKLWSCDLEKQELNILATSNLDCRPTCLGLLDLAQFGNKTKEDVAPTPVKGATNNKAANNKQNKSAENPESSAKARGFVTIEYEQDLQENESETKKKQKAKKPKQQPKKAKAKKPDTSSEEESNSEAEDSEDDEESEDLSESDDEIAGSKLRPPAKRKFKSKK
ncbi:p21-activated protein kinase-interacting protein 1-like [Drosophila willistoni]|uniref:p21-activated protein kinase-interacting protein 1-like n=1 Tax=Drosophila willistoni TaxID=7260 RepID=UPI00017D714B|nr:p21-activated protein kinase-interacting protein 1-like [Drosophila willistoni]